MPCISITVLPVPHDISLILKASLTIIIISAIKSCVKVVYKNSVIVLNEK